MTHISKIFPDDPRLTAYALGELEGEELAAVEAALRDDPAARAAVDEIRAMGAQLEDALEEEPLMPAVPAALAPRRDRKGKVFQFPQFYYITGGLAAAAFALLVAVYKPPVHVPLARKAAKSPAIAVNLPSAPSEATDKVEADEARADLDKGAPSSLQDNKKRDEPAVVVAAVAPQVDGEFKVQAAEKAKSLNPPSSQESAAGTSPVSSNLLKEVSQATASTATPTAVSTVTGSASAGALTQEEAQKFSRVEVASEKDTRRLDANAAPNVDAQALLQQNASQFKNEDARNRAYIQSNTSGAQFNAPSARSAQLSAKLEHFAGKSAVANSNNVSPAIQSVPLGIEIKSSEFLADTNGGNSLTATLEYRSNDSGRLSAAARARSQFNTESYAYQHDNDFLGARENPLSTFSIDVDTASYANVRRFINEGRLPPPDAVRVEELVNYFPYHYAPPAADKPNKDALLHPFAATMEVADAPWAPTHRLVRIGLKGREVSTAQRAAANLVFLLDVSGSMDEPNKLPLVKESMRLLIGRLRPDDRVAIVIYAGASGLALPSTPVAKSHEILDALDSLAAGGSTNGAMGIQLAYDIAKANFVTGGINRVILCTDGDFNVGVTSEGELTRLIEEKAKSGVFLTVLGFGMGNLKDATLEKLADKGNGNYGYVDSRREAEKLLVEQVNGTLVTIAKDVKLQVEFNPAQVASYRLIGYEDRLLKKEDFNNDAVDAGEIGAGHTVTALYEVVPTSQVMGDGSGVMGSPAVDELKYQAVSNQRSAVSQADRKADSRKLNAERSVNNELLTLKVRFKEPAGTVSRKLEFPLTDAGTRFADASTDFKFAAAVAEFGMILRASPHKGTATLADVLAWAQAGADNDAGGYRAEFIQLVRQAQALMK